MESPIRLLLVEDDSGDRLLVRQQAVRRGLTWFIDEVDSLESARGRLSEVKYDAVIVDYSLSDGFGTDLGEQSEIPLVVITGDDRRDVVLDALRARASDFLLKDGKGVWLERLPQAVERSLERHRKSLERGIGTREDLAAEFVDVIQAEGLRRAADHLQRGFEPVFRTAEHYSQRVSELPAVGSDGLAESYQRAIRNSIDRGLELLADLALYARLDQITEQGPAHSAECLGSALRELQPLLAASGARVENGALPSVGLSARRLVILFRQLLKNAVTHRKRPEPRIRVEARPEGDFWRFVVEDDGPGIPLGDSERVFLPFERGSTAPAGEAQPGLGLGLAIGRGIVERAGGKIWHERAPEGGTRIGFTLPRAVESEPRPAEYQAQSRPGAGADDRQSLLHSLTSAFGTGSGSADRDR